MFSRFNIQNTQIFKYNEALLINNNLIRPILNNFHQINNVYISNQINKEINITNRSIKFNIFMFASIKNKK